MTVEEIRTTMLDEEHLGILSELKLHGSPLTQAEVQMDLQSYWSFRDDTAIIDGTAIKGRRIKYQHHCKTKH